MIELMKELLCPTLELMVILPGILLACLPMKQHLRIPPARLAAVLVPFTVLLSFAGGSLCFFLSVQTIWLFVPIAAIVGLVYLRMLRVTRWKSVSVFLAVCGVFSCLGSVARASDLIFAPGNTAPCLSLHGAVLYNLLCWIFTSIFRYPATHAARELLEDDAFARTWYVFWILPLLFVGLNLYMSPIHPELMYQGRMMQGYIVIGLALLFLLLLFYIMFYLMAESLNRNDRLRQENQFLSMQQARYDNLRTAIAETREARHDMRHHFNALQNLAGQKKWKELEKYLSDVQASIPDAELDLCDNAAVDSVASHYGLLCRKQGIPFSFELDLPRELPVPEIDLCLVLSNLLENALEASLHTDPARRQIKAQAYLHSEKMLLLTVENVFDGEIKEKEGVFQSSKRKGEGIGIQSVRRIADKNDGYSRFSHEGGIFRANVMLRDAAHFSVEKKQRTQQGC